MDNFFVSREFGMGVVSGLVSGFILSGTIWLTNYLSKKKVIIVPFAVKKDPDTITIKNIGRYKIQGMEITGQISIFEPNRST
jgi:hypothetical protein